MGLAPTKSKQRPSEEGLFASFLKNLARCSNTLAYVKERGLEKVTEIGYNPGSQTAQMKYCLVFPLKDNQKNTVSFYDLSILNDTDKPYYYSANRKGLFLGYPGRNTQSLILTETT